MGVQRGRWDERGGGDVVQNPPFCSFFPKPSLVETRSAHVGQQDSLRSWCLVAVMPYPTPCKTGDHTGPFPPALPKYLPSAAALQTSGQYCPCNYSSWLAGVAGREREEEQTALIPVSSAPSCSLSLQQVHNRWGVSRDVPPREGVPELPAPGPTSTKTICSRTHST